MGTTASGEPLPRPANVSAPLPATSLNIDFAGMRERWGVEQSPFLLGGFIAGIAALVIGMIAMGSYLSATPAEIFKKTDGYTWLNLADGLALVAAILFAIAGRHATPHRLDSKSNPDLNIGLGLGCISLGFAVVGLIIGLGNRLDAAAGWFAGGQIWALITIAWFLLSHPVPPAVGTTPTQTHGLLLAAAGAALLVIGLIVGLGDHPNTTLDFYNYSGVQSGFHVFGVKGSSIEECGLNALLLTLGWFLGMRPKGE